MTLADARATSFPAELSGHRGHRKDAEANVTEGLTTRLVAK